MHAEDDAVEVDPHRLAVPDEVEVLVHPERRGDAGVQEEQVQPAVGLLRLRRGGHDVVVVGDVAPDERATELVGDAPATGLVNVEQDDVVAAAGQLARDLRAEAGSAAGDQSDLRHQPPTPISEPSTRRWPWSEAPSSSSFAMRSRCCAASPYAYSSRFA